MQHAPRNPQRKLHGILFRAPAQFWPHIQKFGKRGVQSPDHRGQPGAGVLFALPAACVVSLAFRRGRPGLEYPELFRQEQFFFITGRTLRQTRLFYGNGRRGKRHPPDLPGARALQHLRQHTVPFRHP